MSQPERIGLPEERRPDVDPNQPIEPDPNVPIVPDPNMPVEPDPNQPVEVGTPDRS